MPVEICLWDVDFYGLTARLQAGLILVIQDSLCRSVLLSVSYKLLKGSISW